MVVVVIVVILTNNKDHFIVKMYMVALLSLSPVVKGVFNPLLAYRDTMNRPSA